MARVRCAYFVFVEAAPKQSILFVLTVVDKNEKQSAISLSCSRKTIWEYEKLLFVLWYGLISESVLVQKVGIV